MVAVKGEKELIFLEMENECVVRYIESLKEHGLRPHSIRIWNEGDIYPTFHFFAKDAVDIMYVDDHWEMIASDGVGFDSKLLGKLATFLSNLNIHDHEIDFDLIRSVYGLEG